MSGNASHKCAFNFTIESKDLDDAQHGGFIAVISTESLDRDREIVDKGTFEPLPTSIPILVSHNWMKMPVGRGRPFYDGDLLKIEARYASDDEGQRLRSLVNEGIVTELSVGFANPDYDQVEDTWHLTKAELVEASFVSVPSNRDTEILAAKMATDMATESVTATTAEESKTDPDSNAAAQAAAAEDPALTLAAEVAISAAESTLLLTEE